MTLAGTDLSPAKRLLLEQRRKGLSGTESEIPRRGEEGPAPLSFVQDRLLFLDRLHPGSSVYNVFRAFRLTGPLAVGALVRALWEIHRRHEVLDARFSILEGRTVQTSAAPRPCILPEADLRALPADAREGEARRLRDAWLTLPFDLATGPPTRFLLLRLGSQEHVFLLTLHHIVTDGWSMRILFREMGASMRRPLPSSPLQYADYASWQRGRLQGKELADLLAFWKGQLDRDTALLSLPTDRPRPARQSLRGATESRRLPSDLEERLRGRAQSEGATLFLTLLAATQVLLARSAGEAEVVVGIPVANRGRRELENVVGFFANTLPLRGRFEPGSDMRTALGRLRTTMVAALEHQELPVELLIRELGFDRDLSYNPLFQTVFLLQDDETMPLLPDVGVESLPFEYPTAKFDLTLMVVRSPEGLSCAAEYSTDLFEAVTIHRFLSRFEALLAGFSDAPDTRLIDLPLMGAAERHQLVLELNDTPPVWQFQPVHRWFEEQARRIPDAIAVETVEGRARRRREPMAESVLSYAELNARADRLARWLGRQGAGRGDLIGVLGRRDSGMLVVLLAIYKAGAVYLPLDPLHPDDRLATILRDSGARWIAADAELAPRSEILSQQLPTPCARFCWDESPSGSDLPGSRATGSRALDPAVEIGPSDLANVFFTSGSTGRPKGAMVEHLGLLNHLLAKIEVLGIEPDSTVAQNASHTFDICIWQFLAALVVGGRTVIYDDVAALDVGALLGWVEQDGVTVLETVPSLLEPMLSAVEGGDLGLPAVTALVSNAETLPVPLCRRWLERFPDVPLFNTYGITECSDDITHYRLLGPASAPVQRVPVGRPIRGMNVFTLDRKLRPAPLGSPGQLAFAGQGVGRGYLGDPAKTAAVFVPDPLTGALGGRLYLTGDLSRWNLAGDLEFLGRIDYQVKIRGHRVELGEVEAALLCDNRVQQAAVVVNRASPGHEQLVGFVAAEAPLDLAELRGRLRAWLPHYMIPERLVQLAALPVNSNGKIDRRALPIPPETPAVRTGESAPRSPLEERIAEVWGEVLHLEAVGIHDDFFASGGHSLLALQLIARLEPALGQAVRLEHLFLQPTVAGLAEQVEKLVREGADAAGGLDPIQRLPDGATYDLSVAQTWQWFASQIDPANGWQPPKVLWIEGPLNRGALRLALRDVIGRHEVLRTSFHEVEGEPQQRIHPLPEVTLPLYDLAGLPLLQRDDALAQIVLDMTRSPCDLSRPPLLRFLLVGLAPERHVGLLGLPHIVSDGQTEELLVTDLGVAYEARLAGREAPLRPLSLRYVDFAAWQARQLTSARFQAQRDRWLERFTAGIPDLRLPTSECGASLVSLALDASTTARFKELGNRLGATLFMTLLAAFEAVLARWTGDDRLVVGSVVSGRTHPDVEKLAGVFINPLPMWADTSGDPGFDQLVERVRQTVLEALADQEYPFHHWLEELRRRSGRGELMPCSVWLVLNNRLEPLRLGPATASFGTLQDTLTGAGMPAGLPGGASGPSLILAGREESEGLQLALASHGGLSTLTLRRLLTQLGEVIGQLVREPRLQLSQLDLLGARNGPGLPMEPVDPALRELLAKWAAGPSAAVLARTAYGTVWHEPVEFADPLDLARALAEHRAVDLVAPSARLVALDAVLDEAVEPGWLILRRVVAAGTARVPQLGVLSCRCTISGFLPLGATSAGLWTELDANRPHDPGRVVALPGTDIAILDPRGRPSPLGAPGELHWSAGDEGGATRMEACWVEDGGVEIDLPLPATTSVGELRHRPSTHLYSAPRNALERRVASVWEELLGIDQVSVDDDFFALGGSPEIAAELAARLAGQNLMILSRDLVENRTVARLAVLADRRMELAEDGTHAPAPLTPYQRLLHRDGAASKEELTQDVVLAAAAPLDPGRLARHLTLLVGRHTALRAAPSRRGNLWMQTLGQAGEVPWGVVDLSALPPRQREEQLRAAIAQHRRALDPAAGPALRALLVPGQGAPGDLLVLAVSRLLVDEPSWAILAADLAAGYTGTAPDLPAPRSFHHWLVAAERLPAWREMRRGAARSTVLPTGRTTSLVRVGRCLRDVLALEPADREAVCWAAFGRALLAASGEARVVVGLAEDRRGVDTGLADLAGTVGQFGTCTPRSAIFEHRDDDTLALFRRLRWARRSHVTTTGGEQVDAVVSVIAESASGLLRLVPELQQLAPWHQPVPRVLFVAGVDRLAALLAPPPGESTFDGESLLDRALETIEEIVTQLGSSPVPDPSFGALLDEEDLEMILQDL
jgi:amino acid adenylation domain-containing protein